MNDIVLALSKQTRYINSENNVESVSLEFTLNAVGATKQLAMGLQLDNIVKNNISSVQITGAQLTTSNFQTSNNLENSQYRPVIILFDDAHKLLSNSDTRVPLNTREAGKTKIMNVDIAFNTPVSSSDIDINSLNLFGIMFDRNQIGRAHV